MCHLSNWTKCAKHVNKFNYMVVILSCYALINTRMRETMCAATDNSITRLHCECLPELLHITLHISYDSHSCLSNKCHQYSGKSCTYAFTVCSVVNILRVNQCESSILLYCEFDSCDICASMSNSIFFYFIDNDTHNSETELNWSRKKNSEKIIVTRKKYTWKIAIKRYTNCASITAIWCTDTRMFWLFSVHCDIFFLCLSGFLAFWYCLNTIIYF